MNNNVRSIFYPYHPFATYANVTDEGFIDKSGKPVLKGWMRHYSPADNPDVQAVFEVGRDAFDRLGRDPFCQSDIETHEVSSPDDFDRLVQKAYVDAIAVMKQILCERMQKGGLHILESGTDEKMTISDVQESYRPWFVGLQWHLLDFMGPDRKMEHAPIFRELFLIATLESIGDLLVAMCLDGRGQAGSAATMYECYHTALAIESSHHLISAVKTATARKGASERLANDPKQYAKEQIYKAWIEWREGRAQYGKRNSQAAFASAMREKWDVIENVRSIENWCRQWKKGENIPLIEPA